MNILRLRILASNLSINHYQISRLFFNPASKKLKSKVNNTDIIQPKLNFIDNAVSSDLWIKTMQNTKK